MCNVILKTQAGHRELAHLILTATSKKRFLQVKGIPFLAFDAGGVLELFSGKIYKSNVIFDPTIEALTEKLNEVRTSPLKPNWQITIVLLIRERWPSYAG